MPELMRRPRALTLWRPMNWLEDIERWASDVWERPYTTEYRVPKLDMYEDKDVLVMRWELPGFRKEDIDISLEGDCLTLKAERRQEDVSKDRSYYYGEFGYGKYYRTITLPYGVNSTKITAEYHDGILEVRLPKAEEAKAKRIDVTVK